MTVDEAVGRILFHAQPGEGSFLGMLRPYRGLRDDVLKDVLDAVSAAAPRMQEDDLPRGLVAALWSISLLGRQWATDSDGMLRRNELISDGDLARLRAFFEKLDFAVLTILDATSVEAARREIDKL